MTRRRLRHVVEPVLLGVTIVVVWTWPWLSLSYILTVLACLGAAAALFLLGMLLYFVRGFRRWDAWTLSEAQRVFGKPARPRLVGRR